jgi:putative membrane protein
MSMGGIVMLLVPLLIVGGIVAVLFSLAGGPLRGAQDHATSSGLDILKERYAKGEIQRDEYLQKKADLGG